ncbi:MAG TPA: cytochrome c [Turneriella sp.]|nr:cytochrome c [Turneriella sp.]
MKAALACLFLVFYCLPIWAESGETLFREKCVQCHALPDKEALNGKQWKAVLKTMQKRMQEAKKPMLTDEELQKVYCFLTDGNC